ncbi:peptidoglycan-binding protein [Fischerella thermalis CCMEE 5268]|uniref:Peptidoglycan-binding protein n=1 Tax=Fischerella thermalis CCMEE 5268 TaxID=2019662 RepID=A0A2N6KFI5_9CYAN|nr:peptidoglycan-binding protein [Fischerella thermalis]PLZ97910.1 peptidoglycan-binding protein [Fischerella thermalis CCMEE 5268]
MQLTSDSGNSIPKILQPKLNKPELKLGSNGAAVEELQQLLTNLSIYIGKIDGVFEENTQESVKQFQRRVFLPENGIVDDNTWQALYTGGAVNLPELKKGSRGELVKKVQRILKSTHDYIGYVDGEFGAITESAVQGWQVRNNLPDTGIIDEATWRTLSQIPQ